MLSRAGNRLLAAPRIRGALAQRPPVAITRLAASVSAFSGGRPDAPIAAPGHPRLFPRPASAAGVAAATGGVAAAAGSVADSSVTAALEPAIRVIGGFPDLRLTTSYLEEGSWYCASWMRPIVFVHDTLGVEWWAAIVSVSVGLRLLIAPLFFRQVVAGARFQAHAGNTAAFQSRMNALKDDKEALRELLVERRAYFARHGLRMRDILVPTLSQLVVAVSFFWALRRFAYEAHLIPGFLTGGAGSFVALYAPDASVLFGLPGLSMVLSGSAILLNPNVPGMPAQGLTAGGQRLLFFTLASLFNALFLPYFPATTQLYIAITSTSMLVQQLLLKVAPFRAAIGLPANWPLSGEELDRLNKLRGAEGSGPLGQMAENFRGLFVWFSRAASSLERARALDWAGARAVWERGGSQLYLTPLGLRDPGAPPPPETPQPSFIADAQLGRVETVAAPIDGAAGAAMDAASLVGVRAPSPVATAASPAGVAGAAPGVSTGTMVASTSMHRPSQKRGSSAKPKKAK